MSGTYVYTPGAANATLPVHGSPNTGPSPYLRPFYAQPATSPFIPAATLAPEGPFTPRRVRFEDDPWAPVSPTTGRPRSWHGHDDGPAGYAPPFAAFGGEAPAPVLGHFTPYLHPPTLAPAAGGRRHSFGPTSAPAAQPPWAGFWTPAAPAAPLAYYPAPVSPHHSPHHSPYGMATPLPLYTPVPVAFAPAPAPPPPALFHPYIDGKRPRGDVLFDLSSAAFAPLRAVGGGGAVQLSHAELAEPATFPPVTRMTIVVDAMPSWPIVLDWAYGGASPLSALGLLSPGSPGRGVQPITLRDVLEAVHRALQTQISHTDWAQLNTSEEAAVGRAYTRRVKEGGVEGEGVKRVDYLLDRFIFRGLVRQQGQESFETVHLVTGSR